MRLVCPNCAAQYEVDDAAIPDTGREVQCSACGKLWFQPGKASAEAPAPAVAPAPEAAPEPAHEPEPEATAQPEPESHPEEPAEEDGIAPAPVAGQTPRRQLDDSLLAILREEAEREAAQRRTEGLPIETQEEMTLEPAAAQAASRAAAKIAQMQRGPEGEVASPDEEAPEDQGAASRRERLPDIEEINSTLRASSDRIDLDVSFDAPQTLARQRSGFRLGFSLVLLIGLIVVVLYTSAPKLQVLAPPLSPMLERYVASVDAGRVWLDGQLQGVILKLRDDPAQ
ncbi:zinc-ribbon domain-containing protein [Sedimentimonas flavescens]|uniref:zinc-ribbon domain-containing protein n=1 Tax=Sedimentimonas flavescens TaxID=2851012 RepID=UPI0021A273A5|nr:zinc-ribbon domain-containing protein [Sedimentimonas flavescens]MCT2540582.1 zinc-ribbon domain-containing protein [Sedimentimonas flavescens]